MSPGERVLPAAAVIGVPFPAISWRRLPESIGRTRWTAWRPTRTQGSWFSTPWAVASRVLLRISRFTPASLPSEWARLHGRVAEALVAWKDHGRLVDRAEVALHVLASGWNDRRAVAFLVSADDLRTGGSVSDLTDRGTEKRLDRGTLLQR